MALAPGGSIGLTAGGTLDVDSATMTANGGSSNNGGTVTLNSADDLDVDADQVSVTAGTNGGGGSISITTTNSASLALTGTFDASGNGTGAGGSVGVNSAGSLDLSEATLQANGGTTGNGGSISLLYSSSDELDTDGLSATGGSSNGGNITITNSADADLVISSTGMIDTSVDSGATLAGSITLTVNDASSNNISFTIESDGGFNSIMTASGANVTFDATPVVAVGLSGVVANDGDVTINAAAVGGVGVAAVPRAESEDEPEDSVIGLFGTTGHAVNASGFVTLTGVNITAISPGSGPIVLSGNDQTISAMEFDFVTGAFLSATGSHNVRLLAGNFSEGLTVTVPSGGTAGFVNNLQVIIGNDLNGTPDQPNQPVNIIVRPAGSGTPGALQLGVGAVVTIGSGSFGSGGGGPITVTGVELGTQDAQLPGSILIETESSINVGGGRGDYFCRDGHNSVQRHNDDGRCSSPSD
jgi:hypothetical protein